VVDCVSAPVLCAPLVGIEPDQPPEAVHEVALVADQLSVVLPPLETLLVPALRDTAGAGVDTDTVTDCVADPPAPVQVSVYLVVADTAAVLADPLTVSLPFHPPDAEQALALVEVQLSVD
jgi:hypothetical protein